MPTTDHSLDHLFDTQQKKLAFFQNMVLLAAADGILDDSEGDFLLQLGQRLGLSAADVQSIADNLSVLSFIVPTDGMQRTLELQTLVQMMLQDGQVDPREYGLCLDYAHRIGYNKGILDDMVTQLSGSKPSGGHNAITVS